MSQSDESRLNETNPQTIEKFKLKIRFEKNEGFSIDENSYKSHQQTDSTIVEQKPPFICIACNRKFSNLNKFLIHENKYHSTRCVTEDDINYKSSICNKKFSNKRYYTKHLQSHTDIRPYACDICDKRFGNSSNLIVHKRFHRGEKPHSCSVCDKTFTVKDDLIKHERIHTAERPYITAKSVLKHLLIKVI